MKGEIVGLSQLLLKQIPVCHWAFDRQGRIRLASGDTSLLFHRIPSNLKGKSIRDLFQAETAEEWEAAIGRIFSRETLFNMQRYRGSSPLIHSLIHFPIHSAEGEVEYAGGCALDASHSIADATELEVTAKLVLGLQEAERAKVALFLHNELAQGLSAAGLQLDLLRMNLETQCPELAPRTTVIQDLLDDVLKGVRSFSVSVRAARSRQPGRIRQSGS